MAEFISANNIWATKKCEKILPAITVTINGKKIEIVDLSNYDDVASFYLASISGTVDLLKKLIDSGFRVNSPLKTSSEACPILQNYSGFTGLHFAFKYLRVDAVQFLLDQGANIFIPDDKGITPLHVLFESKEQLLQKHSSLESYDQIIDLILQTNEQINDNEVSHFHIACTRNEPETIQNFMLQNMACINQVIGAFPGHEGFSPLHFALKYKCDKVVEILLANGANVNRVDHNNWTALHLTDSLYIANLLLQHGADFTLQDSNGDTALHKAFEERNFKIMDLLVSAHINSNANPTNAIGISHFHIACTRNNKDILMQFLRNGMSVNSCVPTDPKIEYTYYWDDIDWRGRSPLHFAVAFNKSKIVKLLLSGGADVEAKDARGFTALHLACRTMYEKIEELMNNLQELRNEIVMSPQDSLSEYFQKKKEIDWTINRTDQIDIVAMLLEYESDVNCHDKFGNTPLYGAYVYYALDNPRFYEKYQESARANFLQEMKNRRGIILEMLLQHSVDFDTCLDNGSILHYIMKEIQVSGSYSSFDEFEILAMFLRNGASVDGLNRSKVTPLFLAIQARLEVGWNFIDLLIQHGANFNFRDPEKHSTILHVALREDWIEMFNLALSRGADPNAKELDGTTVLHILAAKPNSYVMDIFRGLVAAGVEINARDVEGQTPLFRACLSLNHEGAEMLLDTRADVNIEDTKGKTVLCAMYEEVMKGKYVGRIKKVCSMLKLLLDHVRKWRSSVSEKVLSSREKIIDYYFSNMFINVGKLNKNRWKKPMKILRSEEVQIEMK